jgi:hypothetical protein
LTSSDAITGLEVSAEVENAYWFDSRGEKMKMLDAKIMIDPPTRKRLYAMAFAISYSSDDAKYIYPECSDILNLTKCMNPSTTME